MQQEKIKYLYMYIAALSICLALCVFTDSLWLNLLWLCKGAYSEFEYISLFVLGITNSNNIITAKFFICTVVPLQASILHFSIVWLYQYSKSNKKAKFYIWSGVFACVFCLTLWQINTLSLININHSYLSN